MDSYNIGAAIGPAAPEEAHTMARPMLARDYTPFDLVQLPQLDAGGAGRGHMNRGGKASGMAEDASRAGAT